LFLDIFGGCVGEGFFARVYRSIFHESEIKNEREVTVKVFLAKNDTVAMNQDLGNSCDLRLACQYTIVYEEVFDTKEFVCASMPLMKSSLFKYINSKPASLLIDDEVFVRLGISSFNFLNIFF
jgi:hypothetical protein